jgi:hypothetical protein
MITPPPFLSPGSIFHQICLSERFYYREENSVVLLKKNMVGYF